MSKYVFLFGAGASVEAGIPVMKNFFRITRELIKESRIENSGATKLVFNTITNLRSLSYFSDIDLENIESVLAAFEMMEVLNIQNEEGIDYKVLKKEYLSLIEQTITFSTKVETDGNGNLTLVNPYSKLLKKISSIVEDSSFVSFNYDLAFELGLFTVYNKLDVNYALNKKDDKDAILFLKLHGSLNWFKTNNKEEN